MSAACTCAPDVRTEARFDTRLEPEVALDAATLLEVTRRTNLERVQEGWKACRECEFVSHPNDLEWFFHKKLCTSCGMGLIDELLFKIANRYGRKKTLKLLKRLAK